MLNNNIYYNYVKWPMTWLSSCGEHLGVSKVSSAGGNELGFVDSDTEVENILGKQSRNVRSLCPVLTVGCLLLDWGPSVHDPVQEQCWALDLVR